MRSFVRRCGVMVLLGASLALTGCGGGADNEGIPAGTDMTKDFTPPVDMPGMSPKIQRESAKKAPPPSAPAPAP